MNLLSQHMSFLRNLALALVLALSISFSIGLVDAHAQSCGTEGGSSTTYTCHGDLVSYGGGYSVCYGYITQDTMTYDGSNDFDCDVGGGGGGDSPSVSLTATPTSIESGHSSQLSFSSMNVSSCSIDNGVGTVSANTSGTRTVSPTSNTTYTITCQSLAGAVADTATVTVTAAPQPVTAYCSAGPEVAQTGETVQWSAATSAGGGSGSLTWESGSSFTTKVCSGGTNYTSLNNDCAEDVLDGSACTVEGQRCRQSSGCDVVTDGTAHTQYGSVTPYTCVRSGGSGATYTYSWSGTDGLTGSTQNVSKAYSTLGTKTGQVTVSASTGGSAIATCSVQVAGQAPTASLSANPTSIVRGSSSTLTWSSSNASSCTLNESIGTVSTSGTRSVSPENTTTYTLVCSAAPTSVSGTWQYYDSDTSDFACPLTDPNKAYSSLPNCPSSPAGKACTSTGLCKINTVSGCNINTTLYECTGSSSSPAQSATASATVTVTEPPSVSCSVNDTTVLPGETVTYTAQPQNGARSPYSWSSNSGGSYGTGATATRTFTAVGTYDMRVSASNSSADVCPYVSVSACPGARTASIEASAERVNRGDTVTISWEATGIYSSCTVTGPGGTIHTTTAASCLVPDGSEDVIVNGQSTYTISCDSGAISDSVIVNVVPGVEEF